MFFHNFKYSLKTLLRNKAMIFWTFAFPIILGTLFNLAFSNIVENEKMKVIDIAIVKNDEFESNSAYKMAFEQLSDEKSENRLFNTKYVDKDEANKLLQDEKIVGYMELKDSKPVLTFTMNGTNQTIFKYVVEEIAQKSSIIETMVSQEMQDQMAKGNTNVDVNEIIQNAYKNAESDEVNLKNISNKNMNYVMIEFYTLIAMSCLYGSIIAMYCINQNLPNMSKKGQRIGIAPTKKLKVVASSMLASYVVQLLGLVILFAYTILVLKIDYGNNLPLIVLLALTGSFAGLSMGVFTSSVFKVNENAKMGILLGFTMLGCFLSGMMGITMKYVIDKNVPIINKLNPANMITDGFYSLYYYNTLDRYYLNIASLLIFALILIVISLLSLRRQKYDSI